MIDRTHDLQLSQQARLLGLSWASVYYTHAAWGGRGGPSHRGFFYNLND